ncbi:MAG: FkbM family methyltransferase [Flavobacterium sp.]|nr:MAG: FkbM family methyltransferase [Flavobacterium sp.]
MRISNLVAIFQRWPLKEGLQLCTSRLFKKMGFEVFNKIQYEDSKYFTLSALGLQVKKHGKYTAIHSKDFKQILIRRGTSDIDVAIQIFDWDEFAGLFSVIEDKNEIKTIIDAGANIGISSVKFKSAFPNVSIIAIEPDDSNFSLLNKNLTLNGVDYSSLKSGVWNKKTKLYFDRSFRDGREWAITVTEVPNSGPSIQSFSINDIVEKYAIKVIDILKVDIEGSEKQVFLEANSNLEFLDITRYVAVELHDEFVEKEKIEKLLVDKGFQLTHSGEYLIGKNVINF